MLIVGCIENVLPCTENVLKLYSPCQSCIEMYCHILNKTIPVYCHVWTYIFTTFLDLIMYSFIFFHTYPVSPFIALYSHKYRSQNKLFVNNTLTWMIQSFVFPGQSCNNLKYRTFMSFYPHVFLYICRSLLLMLSQSAPVMTGYAVTTWMYE